MYICKKSWAWQLPHRAMPMSFFYVLVKTSTLFFGSNKIKQGESFNAWGAQVLCEQAPYRNLIGSFKEAHRNLIGTVMGPFQNCKIVGSGE